MKKRRDLHRIYYDEKNLDRFVTVKVANAKKIVRLDRKEADVSKGRAGTTIACMNANCALRQASAFPHPAYLIDWLPTSCYVVDKVKNGLPVHAVRYRHNDRIGVEIHDKQGPRAVIRKGMAQKELVLRPPSRKRGTVTRPTGEPYPREGRENTGVLPLRKRKAIAHGARKRAQAAGILVLPQTGT